MSSHLPASLPGKPEASNSSTSTTPVSNTPTSSNPGMILFFHFNIWPWILRLVRWRWRATTCGATSWWTYSINLHKIAFNRNTSSYSKSNIRNRSIANRTRTQNKNWTRWSHPKNKIKIKNDWQTSSRYFEKYCHSGRSRIQIYRLQKNRPGNQFFLSAMSNSPL